MDEVDKIFLALDKHRRTPGSPIIACLYTGLEPPPYCAPMLRRPDPTGGMALDQDLPSVIANALSSNPAIHDGAVMIGRPSTTDIYRIVGWSYRLFPPEAAREAEPNRGSAFNSCLAMSNVQTIDRIYLVSNEIALRFAHHGIEILRGQVTRARSQEAS
jgi:hypothetical protein